MKKRTDGRYQKNVYIGIGENGKKKYKSVFGRTQAEVNQKASDIKAKLGKGIDITLDDSFGLWKNKWLLFQTPLQTESQLKTYKRYLKHFDELDNIALSKLQIADFQKIINELFSKNPTTGKPTAKKSLREFKATASRVFEFAIENRAIDFNPVKYVRIPKAAPISKRRALTDTEQKWIENTPHRAQLPAMIMMLSGLRRGECLALQWKDIDLEKATIDVHQTLKMFENKSEIKCGAKTEAGVRIVDIPKKLVDFLKQQPPHSPFDYVVTNCKGNLMTTSSWRRLWESYITDLNFIYGDIVNKPKSKFTPEGVPIVIEPFTAHCLRHTHATNLFYAGYDILYIQHQLGHTKPETTLNIYTHLVIEEKKDNISKLDIYFNGKNKKVEDKEKAIAN